jgi:hypothetical protein
VILALYGRAEFVFVQRSGALWPFVARLMYVEQMLKRMKTQSRLPSNNARFAGKDDRSKKIFFGWEYD